MIPTTAHSSDTPLTAGIPPFIVALDFPDAVTALTLVEKLDPRKCRLKVGSELFTAEGPGFVEELTRRGFQIFLDLKFHDIPHTVTEACRAAADLGVFMVDVHTLGGKAMLTAAAETLARRKIRPLLIGVTVLTSMDEADIKALGITQKLPDLSLNLAKSAQDSGLDGIVASAREASFLKSHLGRDFALVTPGIRFKTDRTDDQKRVMTPLEALKAGSDYLVLGRAVTRAPRPEVALENLTAMWRQLGANQVE